MKKTVPLKQDICWPQVLVGSLSVLLAGLLIALFPGPGEALLDRIFQWSIRSFGAFFQWGALLGMFFLIWLAVSRHGSTRLGEGDPEFSKLQILFMVICAGFGAGTLYWGFIETTYYVYEPPFGLAPGSPEAFEMALPYNFFHWGPSIAWTGYTLCSIPIAYALYICKQRDLKFSSVCNLIFHGRLPKLLLGLIDVLFIFVTLCGTCISLGVSLPVISAIISISFGLKNSIFISLGMIALIFVVFVISSMKGLSKGMARLSDLNAILCILFVIGVFLVGPKQFTMDNTTNAIGIMLNDFFRMSTWLSPIVGDTFPREWTVFFIAYWLTFGPFVGIFLAKVSRGHRMRDMVVISLGGGTIGSFLINGILQNYTLDKLLHNELDLSQTFLAGHDDYYIVSIMQSMPLAPLFILVFAVTAILFMATTLDSCAFSLAAVSCRSLDKNGEPSRPVKLFWCLMLTFMPLVLTFINASLNTIKTMGIIATVPMTVVLFLMVAGTFRELKRR